MIEFILEYVNMDVLIGGLIAIVTILVTKILEIYQKSVEQKYTLQLTYFTKKLEAAELAVINFSNEVSKFSQYLAIEEKLVNAKLEEYPFLIKQLAYVKEDAKKDEESLNNPLGKIYLYFDVDNYLFSDNENYKRFLEIDNEIDKIDSDIKTYSNLLEDFKDNDIIQDKIFSEISEKAKAYIPKIKESIELLSKAKTEAINYLSIVKKEMKKYNP